jgi:hypothetical protein
MAQVGPEDAVRIGLQRKPRDGGDWVATGILLYLRVAIFAVVAGFAFAYSQDVLLSLYDSDWIDLLYSDEHTDAWLFSLMAVGILWLLWRSWRAARTIEFTPRAVRIVGPGSAIEIPRDVLLRVDPVRPDTGWLRLLWPRLPACFVSAPVTLHRWYRITHRRGVCDDAPEDAKAFERAFAGLLGRRVGDGPERPLSARWRGRTWSVVSPLFAGILALPFAVLVVLPVALASVDPKEFGYKTPLASRVVLLLHGDELGPSGLSRALRHAADPEVVQYVLQAGTRGGVFEISPDELWPNSCDRRIEFLLRRSGMSDDKLNGLLAATQFRYARADFAQFESELRRCSGTPHYTPDLLFAALDRDGFDITTLSAFRAVDIGSPEFLRYALHRGLAPDERNWLGQTPIMAALAARTRLLDRRNWSTNRYAYQLDAYLRMAEALAAAGADLRTRDNADRSVAYYAAEASAPQLAFKA